MPYHEVFSDLSIAILLMPQRPRMSIYLWAYT